MLTFIWAEKNEKLHYLYGFSSQKFASKSKSSLSSKNLRLITRIFKYSVKLQGMIKFLIVIPAVIMFFTLLSLSSYQDHKSFNLDFFVELIISFPNFILDVLIIIFGANHVMSGLIYLFINPLYPILILEVKGNPLASLFLMKNWSLL